VEVSTKYTCHEETGKSGNTSKRIHYKVRDDLICFFDKLFTNLNKLDNMKRFLYTNNKPWYLGFNGVAVKVFGVGDQSRSITKDKEEADHKNIEDQGSSE